MDMKEQRYGIEIELTGLSRQCAAQVLSEYFRRPASFDGGYYGEYSVLDSQSRRWKVMSDGSITTEKKEGRRIVSADNTYSVELVSPICRYEDIETIQEIVRKFRQVGMIANRSCGIHIHLDASPHNANTLRNITNIMASKEDMIYKATQVEVARERQYCKKVEESFLEELNRKKPRTLDEVSRIWYHGSDGRREHYHNSRYHCLNLHSVFQKGTIEFRLFNATTHAGKIKAYIQLCLAISAQALNQRCASRQKTRSTNEKYTFRKQSEKLDVYLCRKADPESKGKVESVVKFIKINFLENRFYMGLDLLNQSFVMNTEGLILETLKGLLATSTEKVCVLGVEDAQDDLKRLREVYEDLVLFWGLDEDLLDAFDEKIGLVK